VLTSGRWPSPPNSNAKSCGLCARGDTDTADAAGSRAQVRAVHILETPTSNRTADTVAAAGEAWSAGDEEGSTISAVAPDPLAGIVTCRSTVGIRQTTALLPGRAALAIATARVARNTVDDEIRAKAIDAGCAPTRVGVPVEAVSVVSAGFRGQTVLSVGFPDDQP